MPRVLSDPACSGVTVLVRGFLMAGEGGGQVALFALEHRRSGGRGIGVHNEQMGFPSGTVTLLFTDVEGSIRLWEADREAMAEASARYDRLVREQVKDAGGQVFKTVGEAFRAVFADPFAALASAVAIQRAAGAEPWPPGLPIRVRVALHSGACMERDGDYFGPVVNRAARLLAVGHGGQVLVSGAAYELLADRLPGGIGLRGSGRAPPEGPGSR